MGYQIIGVWILKDLYLHLIGTHILSLEFTVINLNKLLEMIMVPNLKLWIGFRLCHQ